MLKIEDLSKKFNEQKVLQSINLNIDSKQIVGLAGPSGSGKSTLMRCIQKLEKPDSGRIICNETTGFMFQDFQLFPHMTVLENLIYAPKKHSMKNFEQEAKNLLKRLGISNKINFYPSNLSGGQKQRVALARILMIRPKLLLCDEPTSGLDIATIREVAKLLIEIKNTMDITIMISSHDLDFLTQISNRILLLKNGSIAIDINVTNHNEALDILHNNY